MQIKARCHPLLAPILPRPTLAKKQLPDWLRTMPGEVTSKTLGDQMIRTLKHCPPFIDALSAGIFLHLVTDIEIANGEVSWDWDPPVIVDAPITRSPIGIHVPEQAAGSPLETDGRLFIKFNNFWTLSAPDGWSLLFTHPFNRSDLPFQTLSGIVDCDAFGDGYVHFPTVLDPGFEGTIKRGTPIVQIIPYLREAIEIDIAPMSEADVSNSAFVQKSLSGAPGIYRRKYRKAST